MPMEIMTTTNSSTASSFTPASRPPSGSSGEISVTGNDNPYTKHLYRPRNENHPRAGYTHSAGRTPSTATFLHVQSRDPSVPQQLYTQGSTQHSASAYQRMATAKRVSRARVRESHAAQDGGPIQQPRSLLMVSNSAQPSQRYKSMCVCVCVCVCE
jgi:hypothetical protein